jgi:RimJ/RimL family protein N-acetyltransferase
MTAPSRPRYCVAWEHEGHALVALEPNAEELRAAAPSLAGGYNEPHNRVMIANEHDYTAEDVVAHFAEMSAAGARTFLLYEGDTLIGDADFRHIEGGRAEFAILVIARAAQGRGLGTRFARMLHALGYGWLGIARSYVTILPENAASLRLFDRLGYVRDASSEARAYADDESDVSLSLDRATFEDRERELLRDIRLTTRGVT